MQVTSNNHATSLAQKLAAASSNSNGQASEGGTSKPSAEARQQVTYSKALGVSAAVSTALLQIQETGSVFDRDDTMLMHRRGVSEEDRLRFAEIVQDAAKTGGYEDPLSYVKSLSKSDIDVLKRVHCFAEAKGVTAVNTEEGAFNLLLPPSGAVDTNNDAVVERGIGKNFVFPPPNAPQEVKDAWEKMTADMSEKDRLLAQVPFMVATIGANIEYDENGTATGLHEPGDANYTNIFDKTKAEWADMLAQMIAGSRSMEDKHPQYIEHTKMLESFAEKLSDELGTA